MRIRPTKLTLLSALDTEHALTACALAHVHREPRRTKSQLLQALTMLRSARELLALGAIQP